MFFPVVLTGQIQSNELPYSFDNQINYEDFKKFEIENFDSEKYLEEDRKLMTIKPYRFAINKKTNISFDTTNFILLDSLKIYYLQIAVPNSKGISLTFSDFQVDEDVKIFLFDNNLEYTIGAFSEINNKKNKILSTQFIPSDSIIVEVHVSLMSNFPNFHISDIGCAYRNIKEESDWCEIDINCNEDPRWQTIKKATLKIIYQEDDSYYACSGTLMANTRLDNTPYYLTANHCVNTQEEANSTIFYFNYEYTECEGEIAYENQTISGAHLIATADDRLDFTLLELSAVPPKTYNPFYAGWSRQEEYDDTTVCIHHPAGDVKKISIDYNPLGLGSFSGYDPNKHWQVLEWDEGTTEGGSSGSGLFTKDMFLIGDLSGGDASCDYNYDDYYQQFYHCWDDYNPNNQRLKTWLDSFGFNPMQIEGYDPYENIDLEVPIDFQAELYDSLVTLSWIPPENEPDKYIIYKNLKPFYEAILPETVTDILDKDGVYVYYATAIYENEESKPSTMRSLVYGDTSSIPKVTEIKVYPNPSTGIFYIVTPDSIPITKVEIFNPNGQLVKIFEINQKKFVTLNIDSFYNSFYFLRIHTVGDTYLEKIGIIRNH